MPAPIALGVSVATESTGYALFPFRALCGEVFGVDKLSWEGFPRANSPSVGFILPFLHSVFNVVRETKLCCHSLYLVMRRPISPLEVILRLHHLIYGWCLFINRELGGSNLRTWLEFRRCAVAHDSNFFPSFRFTNRELDKRKAALFLPFEGCAFYPAFDLQRTAIWPPLLAVFKRAPLAYLAVEDMLEAPCRRTFQVHRTGT